ncbi:glycoside hydrolase family 38 C-terminal domain-containing protein [Mucilaginibacter sp. dw_454]|uniref:glycoside hydrolase family 38 N-terminal domain-containing protein n=1 Tax=Mucilaginibacter sp. dw_454 TaxID=2720079 RepID=UPI001BD3E943|nr:glycoside hydrolase family 38 C-terminal domain-containing protein [Mucilaginibacter sp. dw_454]
MKSTFVRATLTAFCFSLVFTTNLLAQQPAYFIDGYHGGVWGHYPDWNTRFMADQLTNHPDWKINLEIEPETWAVAKQKDEKAYNDFRALFADQSITGRRIEYVNPAYGQSYLYNISGESIIRQLAYGMETLHEHFPSAVFTTYSSEEPCFTSALPQILKSFGFKYASLKNPNTCWGGYTRAHGGELVNWIGPDGTSLVTVPRYAIEALKPGSTWETIGNSNNKAFIDAAFNAGIQHPVAFTLQDAGWKGGPMMGDGKGGYQPTQYKTWTDYIENSSIKIPTENWKFSQEDVLTSLVWGSQILQRIAQQVRVSENKLITAEKLAAMAAVYKKSAWPKAALDEGWTRLLLSQHHDCWIVPYNMGQGNTWADKVVNWTGITNKNTDSIAQHSKALLSGSTGNKGQYIRVFNTLGVRRNEIVKVALPANLGSKISVWDNKNHEISSQVVRDTAGYSMLFKADVPSIGYASYRLKKQKPTITPGAKAFTQTDGRVRVETDLYTALIDPAKGGTIQSLVAKQLGNKEFVDKTNARKFNELRGDFFKDGGFHSSADQPATVTILDKGPAQVKLQIKGMIDRHPFTQLLTFTQSQRRIDVHLKINWKGNPAIGNPYGQTGKYEATSLQKAFYDDRDKLLALFPLNLKNQKVYKNAPFDVTESRLDNTFFTRWDSIKNNVVLNWVDVTDANNTYGMAMLTDHTTNYAHGEDFPLGVDIAYSGVGLWGRNYTLKYPTEMNYALIPHAGKWDKAGIWTESTRFNEPLSAVITDKLPAANDWSRSMISGTPGLEISSVTVARHDLLVRIFNAEGDDQPKKIKLNLSVDKVELIELNGKIKKELAVNQTEKSATETSVNLPRFGIRTLKFVNAIR